MGGGTGDERIEVKSLSGAENAEGAEGAVRAEAQEGTSVT